MLTALSVSNTPTPCASAPAGLQTPEDRFESIARQVSPKTARAVKRLKIPGIYLQDEPKRYYPSGRLASHLLGFVNIDGTVLAGIERQYQGILEGEPGHMTLEQDPMGRPLPQAEFSYEAPSPGRSLFLTIDKELQYFTELTLAESVHRYKAEAGTAIVMAPRTGEILALAKDMGVTIKYIAKRSDCAVCPLSASSSDVSRSATQLSVPSSVVASRIMMSSMNTKTGRPKLL